MSSAQSVNVCIYVSISVLWEGWGGNGVWWRTVLKERGCVGGDRV